MPEGHENTIGNKVCQKFIEEQPAENRTLVDIHTDVTGEKTCLCAYPKACPASEGHVHTLLSSYPPLLTGITGNSGTGLYPAMYSATDPDIPIEHRGLVLQEAEIDARNYILKFVDKNKKQCWIQLQPLTHTVIQIYTKDDWDGAIIKVNKNIRGFKVALAFQFWNHVMAFVSQDLLFQVFWEKSRKDLPVQYADIYLNPIRFLEDVTAWMLKQRGGRGVLKPKSRKRNALLVVRDSPVFHGVGLYTVSELWHMAGLSPSLTEENLFDSPSRTARLCAAYYHFSHVGHNELWEFTKKYMKGYVIAASTSDRQLFSKFLHVWGQDRVYLSKRHHGLLTNNQKTGFDAFEPELIRHAFHCKAVNFGSLIFGQELWKKLSVAQGLSTSTQTDPLTKHFSKITVKKSGLSLSAYDFLFHEATISRPLAQKWMPTYCYRGQNRDIWSIYPDASAPFDPILGEERQKRLLSFVTKHRNTYTVGPLDYCGIAKLVCGRGQDKMLICNYDLRASVFYIKRRALEKETVKLKAKGTEHSGINPAVKRKLMHTISTLSTPEPEPQYCTPSGSSSSSLSPIPLDPNLFTVTDQTERPTKRLRRSSDRDICISTTLPSTDLRITRSKSRK